MKKLLIGLALITSATTHAQTSSTSAQALPSTSSTSAANPASTSTLSTTAEQNSIKSRFGANVIVEASAAVGDLKKDNSKAMIDSLNAIGLTYKISDALKTELRHNYQMRVISDRDQLATHAQVAVLDPVTGEPMKDADGNEITKDVVTKQEEPYIQHDPTIHLNWKTPFTLLGSKPISSANRYYIPVGELSRDAKNYGTLRTTQTISWDLTTKWALDVLAEMRLTMNSTQNAKAKIGSDSTLRYVFGPSLTYNFNDMVSAYYMPYFDLITTGHQRGNFGKADQRNDMYQELGVNVAVGSFTINPYLSTKASRPEGSEGYEGFGSDADSSYNLLLQAVF